MEGPIARYVVIGNIWCWDVWRDDLRDLNTRGLSVLIGNKKIDKYWGFLMQYLGIH